MTDPPDDDIFEPTPIWVPAPVLASVLIEGTIQTIGVACRHLRLPLDRVEIPPGASWNDACADVNLWVGRVLGRDGPVMVLTRDDSPNFGVVSLALTRFMRVATDQIG